MSRSLGHRKLNNDTDGWMDDDALDGNAMHSKSRDHKNKENNKFE